MAINKKIIDYIDLRLGIRDLLQKNLTEYLLPRNINIWYSLGAATIALFAVQFITGIFLLIYYIPNTEQAFASVQAIMNEIPYGWLIRYLHAIGANVVVLVLLLHMLSALFMSAYKRPREFTWLFGFLIFMVTLGMCLTGYLLPWSQLSYWATTVATDTMNAVPLIGEPLLQVLRGGSAVGQYTLGRFFALHVMGLPLIFGLLVSAHLFCVRRIGVSRPPFGPDYRPWEPNDEFQHEEYPDGIPFFPNYTAEEVAVIAFFLALTTGITYFAPWIFLPSDAFTPADPFVTPEHIKPEWYFLASYQILKVFPNEFFGILVQGVIITFLLFLPWIDRTHERRPAKRPIFVALFVLGVVGFVGLTIWGHFS